MHLHQSNRFYIVVMRIIFFLYWVYLSILLFSRDPARWVNPYGNLPELLKMLMPYAHVLSFTVLSILTFAAFLPLPRWGILLVLLFYGGVSETMQGLVPSRTPEWADLIQDLAGVVAGFACFWFVMLLLKMFRKNSVPEASGSS
jgi:VanZ family protein